MPNGPACDTPPDVPANLNALQDELAAPSPYKLPLLELTSTASERWAWNPILAALGLVGVVTLLGLEAARTVGVPNLVIVYVLVVVFSALRWGRWPGVVSAVASAFLFEFCFIPPYRRLAPGDLWYVITLVGFIAVGLLVSMLESTARSEARGARNREAYMTSLYSLTASLVSAGQLEQILETVGRHMLETFRQPIVIWLPGEDGLVVRFRSPGLDACEDEAGIAAWAFRNGQDAGMGTATFAGSKTRFLPLKTWNGVVGVLGFQPRDLKEWVSSGEAQLVGAFANQAALAITRALLEQSARRAHLLQETDRLQKALLNSISHDLRTPLASVSGALDSVLSEQDVLDPSTQREMLETARSEARRLNRLVQNLLDMTRLEGGAMHLNTEPSEIVEVIGAAVAQLADSARARKIEVDLAPDLPLVPMDFVLIVQVLVNLLDNAIKYSPDDTPVEVEARSADRQLCVRVSDRGRGIPEAALDHVFEKFYRCAPSRVQGSGLGLSICKGLVEAHGGRIWLERRRQGGTIASFTLPVGDAA